MSYQTVLVCLDAGPRCAARVALAARLVSAAGGRLVGLAPTGLPDVIVSVNSAVPDAVECIQLSADWLRESAEAVAHDFERQAAAVGASSFEARVVEAEPVDAAVRLGRCADLVVVGQTNAEAAVDGVPRDFPQQLALHTGTPVLVVPFAGSFETIGRRILVAWKNTREAARAMHDALPLLRGGAKVTLLAIAETGADAAPGADTTQDVLAWLVAQGVAAESRTAPRSGEVGDALLSMASQLSCDLVVMGAYGHSRLHEWVLGGATRQMLAQMTVPVLMSH